MTDRSHHGFTVVELITVILLMGILAVGTVRFLNDASSGFASATQRGEISAAARQSIQHLAYAIRDALPNSIRVTTSGDCLELIPILNGTTYISGPIGIPGAAIRTVPFDQPMSATVWRTAIAPGSGLYTLSNPGSISPATTASLPDAANITTLTFASAHQFNASSPQRRAFAVSDPVSFCVAGGDLYRYQNYGFSTSQPTVAALPSSLPDRQMLMGDLTANLPVFTVTAPTLTRNGIVQINIELERGDANLRIAQTVQVRNQL